MSFHRCTLVILLTFCLGWSCSAQTDYLAYHKTVIAAEDLFLRDRHAQSLELYKKTFSKYRPFARDAFIAAQVAAKFDDTASLTLFLGHCYKVGIPWSIISNSYQIGKVLSRFHVYKETQEQRYRLLRPKYFRSIDPQLRKEFTTYSRRDDTARNAAWVAIKRFSSWRDANRDSFISRYGDDVDSHVILRNYRKNHRDFANDPFYSKLKRLAEKHYRPLNRWDTAFVKVLEENIKAVAEVSRRLGFVPGEKSIGIADDEGQIHDDLIFSPIVIHQFYHHGCGFALLQKELLESVKRGEIHPRLYGCIYDQAYCNLKDKAYDMATSNYFPLYKLKCPLPKKQKSYAIVRLEGCDDEIPVDRGFIDACREELGISSLEHDEKKKDYGRKHKMILSFGLLSGEEL